MAIVAVEFDTGTRYCWQCARCNYVSLPFKDEQRAWVEQGLHWSCRQGRRGSRDLLHGLA